MSKVKIYADGAVITDMKKMKETGIVKGFTTNPTLMKKAGIKSYKSFAQEVLKAIPDFPISFEVFADDLASMEKEALEIASWGNNVSVKIPIMTTQKVSTIPLIEKLSAKGISLNVTAIMTVQQVKDTVNALTPGIFNIVSVFAGRIADSGRDPMPTMKEAEAICHAKAGVELLWASPREVLNIIQADVVNCDIITCTPEIITKYMNVGKDLEQISLETVQMFFTDSQSLGYSVFE